MYYNNVPVIVYHANCLDGMAAAMVMFHHFKGAVQMLPANYGDKVPECEAGSKVYIVDFSYKRDDMLKLGENLGPSGFLCVLDHHKSAELELTSLAQQLPCDREIRFDMTKSGAVMAWEFCYPGETVPPLLRHIQDHDLWQFQLDGTREIVAALRSYPVTLEVWDSLVERSPADLIPEGRSIRRYIEQQIAFVIENARLGFVDGRKTIIANCQPAFISEAGNRLLDENDGFDFSALYYDYATLRAWSLRSKGAYDVSAIATKFGGGGHCNAAGFVVPLP